MTVNAKKVDAVLVPKRLVFVAALMTLGSFSAETSAQQSGEDPLTKEFLIGSAVSLSNQSYDEIDKAIQRFNNSDVPGAVEYLNRAKEKYPKLPPSDVMLAKMHLARRNARAVRILLESAIVKHPEDPDAYLILANQAFASNLTAEAHALYVMTEPLVENFTGNAKRKRNFTLRVLAGLSAVAQRRSQWEQSYQVLKRWIDVEPGNPVAHARLGVALFRLDKPKEALAEFTEARKINPDMAHPYVSLGQLFAQSGDVEKAQKSFDRAYNEDKTDANVARAYAEWLIQQRNLDQAQTIAASLREQAPESETALLLDGIVAYMKGQADRAQQALEKLLRLNPRHARATDLLALLLVSSDKIADQERALSYAELNAKLYPENSQVTITKAWVLYQLGRTKEWRAALQQAKNLQVGADSTYLIARIFAGEGKKKEAKQALERVLGPKSTLVLFRREAEELLKQLEAEGI